MSVAYNLEFHDRHYDPRAAKFISEDPIGFSGGFNSSRYVGNNPLSFSDPFGTTQCDIDLAISVVSGKYPGHKIRVGSSSETRGTIGEIRA